MTEETGRERMFPRDKGPSIWRRISWKWNSFYYAARSIPRNIWMIIQWIPVLWNNYDYDYHYLLEVIEYKMRRIQKHIREHDHFFRASKVADQIKYCEDAITRIKENNYDEKELQAHKEKWGETIIDSVPIECDEDDEYAKEYGPMSEIDIYSQKARDQGLEEQERIERRAIYDLSFQRREKDLDRLFKVMRKSLEQWWC